MKEITVMTQEINKTLINNKVMIENIIMNQYKDKLFSEKKGLKLVTELSNKSEDFWHSLSKVLNKSDTAYIKNQIEECIKNIEDSWLGPTTHTHPVEYLIDDNLIDRYKNIKEKIAA
jgi:predicted DNA-binding protein